MASAGVHNRGGDHPKVRFSSIQYHDPAPLVEQEIQVQLPKQLPPAHYFKYAQVTDSTTQIDSLKGLAPDLDSRLNVDHQHYEQWARVPSKRVTNSILLRGIQQLKARAKRDALEEENRAYGCVARSLQSRELGDANPKDVVLREANYREGYSRLGSTKEVRFGQAKREQHNSFPAKEGILKGNSAKDLRDLSSNERDKTEAKVTKVCLKFNYVQNTENNTDGKHSVTLPSMTTDTGFNKPHINIRPHQADSVGGLPNIDRETEESKFESKYDTELQSKSDAQLTRDFLRSRYGTQKLRERSPFPVSITQQKYYGEPMFLVRDPYKHKELPKSKSRTDIVHDVKADSLNGIRNKMEVAEIRLPTDAEAIQDEFYRSKSFVSSFPSKKQSSRTPAQVPSAGFCDISQLEDAKQRHSAYASLLERSRSESAFSCKNPNLLKWVPRVQRMKDLLK